jgi:putative IMPACT (imprinted ancient) family translation regulator
MQELPAPLFPIKYHTAREQLIFENIIEDRGSRYTVSIYPLSHMNEYEIIRKGLDTNATHHSYAWRILQDDGTIIQDYDDDGET